MHVKRLRGTDIYWPVVRASTRSTWGVQKPCQALTFITPYNLCNYTTRHEFPSPFTDEEAQAQGDPFVSQRPRILYHVLHMKPLFLSLGWGKRSCISRKSIVREETMCWLMASGCLRCCSIFPGQTGWVRTALEKRPFDRDLLFFFFTAYKAQENLPILNSVN